MFAVTVLNRAEKDVGLRGTPCEEPQPQQTIKAAISNNLMPRRDTDCQ
jgi:hypothetical protein